MRVRTAVFPVAGWGTRFLPATKAVPKELLPVFDRPAIQYAMEEAVAALRPRPHHLLIDGPRYHNDAIPYNAIVGGDASCFAIAAASIVAKVTRDALMVEYDHAYPGYGFAQHKGYGTKAHRAAIQRLGPSPIHRRSFRLLPEA